MRFLVLSVVALLVALPTASADVLVVAAGGGADFQTVSAAINNAVDGDVILVRPGNYSSGPGSALLILDKAITVTGEGSGIVRVGPVRVINLSAGKTVTLRNLRVQLPVTNNGHAGLNVQSSPGRVWAENCVFPGQDGFFTLQAFPASPGVSVTNSGDVILLRSAATGGIGVDSFFPYAPTPGRGGYGIEVSGSGALTLHGCTLTGGRGGNFVGFDGGPGPGGNGGDAVFAPDGEVLVSGCTLTGGNAGSGDAPATSGGGFYRGGDGVDASGLASVRVKDTAITTGAGGPDGAGGTGPAGQAYIVPDGVLVQYGGTHRALELSGPTPEGTNLHLEYHGELGDYIGVFVGLSLTHLPLPFEQGNWVLSPPLFGPYILGAVTDPFGTLGLNVTVPDFGFGPEDAIVLYEQVYLQDDQGLFFISSPATHIIVDGSL